jgi:hypothetical protein
MGYGAFLTGQREAALTGLGIMISVSILVGAWIIGYSIGKK